MKYTLYIPDIVCENCTKTIKNALTNKFSDYMGFTVSGNAVSKEIIVCAKGLNKEAVYKVINEVGFDINTCSVLNDEKPLVDDKPEDDDEILKALRAERIKQLQEKEARAKAQKESAKKAQKAHLFASLLLLIPGLALFSLSFLPITIPFSVMLPLGVLSTVTCFFTSKDMYINSLKKLYATRSMSMDTLFSISTFCALSLSFYAFFNPMVGFEFHSALLILASKRMGQYFDSRLNEKLETHGLFTDDIPQSVAKVNEGLCQIGMCKTKLVHRDIIEIGQKIMVYEGEVIPLDGCSLTDKARVFTTNFDGDTEAKNIKKGQAILAGMRVKSGTLLMEVTKPFCESYAASVEHALLDIQGKKSKLERFSERVMNVFIPSLLVMTVTCGVMTASLINPLMGIHTALAMLVAACPCILGLIIPVSVKMAAKRVGKEGIILNHPEALEKAATVKAIAFDINGTLTESKIRVTGFNNHSNESNKHLFDILYTLEKFAQGQKPHNISESLLEYVKPYEPEVVNEMDELSVVSFGVKGSIGDDTIYLGNRALIEESGFSLKHLSLTGHTLFLYSKQKGLLAEIQVKAPLKAGVKETLAHLADKGITLCALTGAHQKDVLPILNEVGIDIKNAYCQQQGATEKLKTLAFLEQKYGPTAMVGDGGNDVLALKGSALGITFDDGATSVKSQADFIICNQRFSSIIDLLSLSTDATTIMKRCLIASLIYNVSAIALTCCFAFAIGGMSPVAMALLMSVQSVATLLYASQIRNLKRQNPVSSALVHKDEPKTKSCCQKKQPSLKSSPKPMLEPSKTTKRCCSKKGNDQIVSSNEKRFVSQTI